MEGAPLTDAAFRSALADALEGAAERLRSKTEYLAKRPTDRARTVAASIPIVPPDEKLTITVSEAAERLGISRSSAYDAVRSGTIPSLRIGRRLLVPTHALHQRLSELASGRDTSA